jgi:hypothetical protein
VPRKEGGEDEGVWVGRLRKDNGRGQGEHWVRVCPTWTGRFWDSAVVIS